MTLVGSASAGQIIIPKIGLKDRVGMNLDAGPQWVWNARPGMNRSVWIAGHRTTHTHPFLKIDKLQKGDKIYVKNDGKMFRYVVTASRVVPSTYSYHPRQAESLMLSACARWDGTPTSAAFRIVVFAKPDVS
jgi:LPXTG-site transpeptidase (sortase) family protein